MAVRRWLPGTRVLARVKSDPISALRTVRLSSKSTDLNVVAQELTLGAVLGGHCLTLWVVLVRVAETVAEEIKLSRANSTKVSSMCRRVQLAKLAEQVVIVKPRPPARCSSTCAGRQPRSHSQVNLGVHGRVTHATSVHFARQLVESGVDDALRECVVG